MRDLQRYGFSRTNLSEISRSEISRKTVFIALLVMGVACFAWISGMSSAQADECSCTLQWESRTLTAAQGGSVNIDDNDPAGSGLTINQRTVHAPRTVEVFERGVNALDGFVNSAQLPFGTSDADTDDEFWPLVDTNTGAIAGLMQDVETYRAGAKAFSDQMWALFGQIGGVNPVTYRWKDSQGNHRVAVEVSKFVLAQVKKKKKGNWLVGKICQQLKDFSDNGAKTWVKVTQQDPSSDLGFWSWNPFTQKTVTKKACASYSFNRVGLVRCP